MVDDGHDRLGGAGGQTGGIADDDLAHVLDGGGVDVLHRGEVLGDGDGLVNVVQRTEGQDAVDRGIGVHGADGLDVLILGDVGRQGNDLNLDVALVHGLGGALLVGEVGALLAHAQNAQLGGDALGAQRVRLRAAFFLDRRCDRSAVQYLCHR